MNEGSLQAPKFKSTVLVDDISYVSANIFSHRKTVEQDIAKYILKYISKKLKDKSSPLIREVYCLLLELLCQNVYVKSSRRSQQISQMRGEPSSFNFFYIHSSTYLVTSYSTVFLCEKVFAET